MTVTEIECDHSCTWDKAREIYNENAQKKVMCFFGAEKDINGKPNYHRVFLAVAIDAARVRLTYPHRIKAGVVWVQTLQRGALSMNMANQAMAQNFANVWERNLQTIMAKSQHLEKFALLNGSVFSIWYNVRKAMDPAFDPDTESRHSMQQEATEGNRGFGRAGRRLQYNFEPNVKIQLVTTSDGQKLGGIRLQTFRPMVHRKAPFQPECNKAKAPGRHPDMVPCRKKACMVEGHNEVDKLVKGLAMYTRALTRFST